MIWVSRSFLAAAALLAWGSDLAVGQAKHPVAQLWRSLEPGPFDVGFRVLYRLDRSRVWEASPDSLRRGEFTRPVRLSIWYPARARRSNRVMRYREYVHHTAPDGYFARLDRILEGRNVESLKGIFTGAESHLTRLMELSTAASLMAPAADDRFPLVMYSQGWNSALQNDNTVLAEYLASHGYVVVAVPQVGESAVDLTLRINPVDLEVQMRDVEYAMGVAQELPFVERSKIALMGWSMGGVVALWIAGRNPNVDAIVGLDASFRAADFIPMVFGSPYFDIRRVRVPVLALQTGSAKYTASQDDRVVDSLHFAERYVGRVRDITHGDFSDFAAIAKLFPVPILDRTAEQASRGHEAVCRSVLAFLDGALRPGERGLALDRLRSGARGDEDGIVTLTHRPAAVIPSEEELVTMLSREGFERTVALVDELKARHPGLVIVRYPVLTRLGYRLLREGRHDLAISVFRLNSHVYPASADAFDSLADAFLAAGDSGAARSAYERVLALLPSDTMLAGSAREELRRRATERPQAHSQHPPLVIRNVTVIPATGATPTPRATVVVADGRIREVSRGAPQVPPGAQLVDGTGKYLIPGLFEMHGHVSKARGSSLGLFVANGVTTVRDMGGDHQELLGWRREVRRGDRVGPRLLIAGPYLESANNVRRQRNTPPEEMAEPVERTRVPVGSPEDAKRVVDSLAQLELDYLKIRTVQNRETYRAIVAAARVHGLDVVGHAGGPPEAVLEAGQRSLEHGFLGITLDSLTRDQRMILWRRLADADIGVVPTLVTVTASVRPSRQQLQAIVDDSLGRLEPRRRYLSRFLIVDWQEQVLEHTPERQAFFERTWPSSVRNLREMREAGVRIMAGSDAAVLNVFPGSSVHEELALFVSELGFTSLEAIEAATRKSAEFLRLADSVGTIEPGKVADLVLLDADPLSDIRNTRRIAAVVLRGRLSDRRGIDELLASVEEAEDRRINDWPRRPQ